ncbi:MAG: hypothetical protein ACPLXP_01440 [Microgenomates group bacterium]
MKFWQNLRAKKISKRQKFVISAFLLSLGLLGIEISNISWRYQAIALLIGFAYFLSAWSLTEGLGGVEWFTVLVLPTLFTAGVGLFYFLLPAAWLTRIPVIILYGLGIYILLLVGNIFSVAAVRTIQLLRSAQAVGFLLTLVTSFFLYDTILSFRFAFWLNFLLAMLVSFPLIVQGLWCINLEEKITLRLLIYTFAFSLIQGEVAAAFSFWPVKVAVGSLALSTALYISLGLAQQQLAGRLFPKTINEYFGVGIIVLLVIFLTTHWGG